MSFHTVSGCQRSEARARQLSSLLCSSSSLCSPLSGWGTAGAEGSSACFTWTQYVGFMPVKSKREDVLLTCVKMPVVPQGLSLQPGGVLLVAGILAPDPDQNQPLTRRGWSEASVKHLTLASDQKTDSVYMYLYLIIYSFAPLTHGSVTDVTTGPDKLSTRSLHLGPDQPPLLLSLEADQVHAPLLAPVPSPRPVPHHRGQVHLLVPSRHHLLLLRRQQV